MFDKAANTTTTPSPPPLKPAREFSSTRLPFAAHTCLISQFTLRTRLLYNQKNQDALSPCYTLPPPRASSSGKMPYNNTPIAPSKEVTGHVSLPRTLRISPYEYRLYTNHPSVARVQKIIHADPERLNVSKNAAFAIALATEMFIQHLATTTHNVVKTERKPRRNIQYRDVSSAIAKTDNLEFAVDVVPKTMTFKEAKKRKEEREERERKEEERKEKEKEERKANGAGGQRTLDGGMFAPQENTKEAANGALETPNGATSSSPVPVPEKVESAPDAMDVDERVEDSDKEEEDAAAMQLEMEMRGPPRQPATASPEARRSGGGFTSINGAK
jgi:DNA polymerase epsilon subunit 4